MPPIFFLFRFLKSSVYLTVNNAVLHTCGRNSLSVRGSAGVIRAASCTGLSPSPVRCCRLCRDAPAVLLPPQTPLCQNILVFFLVFFASYFTPNIKSPYVGKGQYFFAVRVSALSQYVRSSAIFSRTSSFMKHAACVTSAMP